MEKPSVFKVKQQCHKTLPSYHCNDFNVVILTFFLFSCLNRLQGRDGPSFCVFVEHKYILNVVVTVYFYIIILNGWISVGLMWYGKQHFHIWKTKNNKETSEKGSFWKIPVLTSMFFWPKLFPLYREHINSS